MPSDTPEQRGQQLPGWARVEGREEGKEEKEEGGGSGRRGQQSSPGRRLSSPLLSLAERCGQTPRLVRALKTPALANRRLGSV